MSFFTGCTLYEEKRNFSCIIYTCNKWCWNQLQILDSFLITWWLWKPVQLDGHLDWSRFDTSGSLNNGTCSCINLLSWFLQIQRYQNVISQSGHLIALVSMVTTLWEICPRVPKTPRQPLGCLLMPWGHQRQRGYAHGGLQWWQFSFNFIRIAGQHLFFLWFNKERTCCEWGSWAQVCMSNFQ